MILNCNWDVLSSLEGSEGRDIYQVEISARGDSCSSEVWGDFALEVLVVSGPRGRNCRWFFY